MTFSRQQKYAASGVSNVFLTDAGKLLRHSNFECKAKMARKI
jgi:hypothetical protein